jgi:hypothetical protein
MLNETVRPQTLPSELALQLLLGNALEIVYLLNAGCEVEAADRDLLRRTARSLTLHVDLEGSVRLAAASSDSLELLVAAARSGFGATDLSALNSKLNWLADGLQKLADGTSFDTGVPSVIDALASLHDSLIERSFLQPDEVRASL